MEFNLADLFEHAVDHFADRECVVADGRRRTYAALEARANRLAHHLAAHGVGPGDHVGIYAYNGVEWVETLWAILKLRAVFVNINYRYVEDELAYLFGNADLVALVLQREFAPRVRNVGGHTPRLRHRVMIEDGSGADAADLEVTAYEAALAAASPARDFGPRSPDDRYILYTGGTTGMPKGVVWRQEDAFFALGGGIDVFTRERVQRPEDMVEKGRGMPPHTMMPLAPLMHGASQWCVMSSSFVGRKTVLAARFDPAAVWDLVAAEGVNTLFMTGDAMARPLAEALETRGAHDLGSLMVLVSTAAVFSPSVKDHFFRLLPNVMMTESIGSSETGSNGTVFIERDRTAMHAGGLTVPPGRDTVVLDEAMRPVAPGSGVVGRIARSGNIPLGYYGDPAKTEETFVTVGGVRYAIPGDFARVEADGSITLLGRGSVSINSGGEKIFPEEVEAAVKSHPDVYDAVVVGVPDERWGSRVAAVIEPRPGAAPALADVQAHCRQHIAGYKLPRELHVVERIERSPSGKPDYRWAAAVARREPR